MYKVALVNMPLGNLALPSIALTQLSSVLRKRLGDRVDMRVLYLNHDFAHYLSPAAYHELNSFVHHASGLGEWFFRPVAFPELPDNSDAYFQRYYPQHDAHNRAIRDGVLEKRAGLDRHFDEMIDRHNLDRVDMVGFTSMFSQNLATLAMARKIKARNPNVVVVMGGANCEAPMGRELIELAPQLDFVFSGPSLKSFPELVRRHIEGDVEGCHRINGVFSRRNQVQAGGCGTDAPVTLGAPVVPVVAAFGDDDDINDPMELDYIPFLDQYEANFPNEPQPSLMFETSRGCWWGERAHCTFCGLNGSTISYRAMRPPLAVQLLNTLFQHSGRVKHLQSVDNILPKSYFSEFLPYLDTPENMDLFYEVKADLGEDEFRVLARARVKSIQPGIEALNTGTLKLMRKGTSSFQNIQFLINSARYDINPMWNLLIGFPGEEIEVYEKYLADLPLLTHLPPPGGVFPVRFDRFSPYYTEADSYGLQLHPLDWYELTYPYQMESLMRLAYYFADQNYAAPYAMNVAKMVGRLREKVDRWIAMWAQPDRRPRLELRSRDGRTTVLDTRSGEPREYPLRPSTRRVLDALAKPKKMQNLADELPGLDVEAEVAILRERGLVFQENERILSLIIPPVSPVSVPVVRAELANAMAAV